MPEDAKTAILGETVKENPQRIVKPAVVQVDFLSDETDLRSGASEVSFGAAEVAGRLGP
jgi:hypothetical protein